MKSARSRQFGSNRPSGDFQEWAEQKQPGLIAEFCYFLLHNKKWWLIPIIVVLLLIGALLLVSGTGLSWVMYTLA